jgi:hypothetical protein
LARAVPFYLYSTRHTNKGLLVVRDLCAAFRTDKGEAVKAKYGKAAGKSVKSAMHREKRGTLRSGKGGKGGKVTSRKQAVAIGLSEARKKGAKVPRKKS